MLYLLIWPIFLIFLWKLIHQYIIKPKLLLSFYKKQNILTFESPDYKTLTDFNLNFYGDSLYHQKAFYHTSNASKLYAIKHGQQVLLTIVDQDLKKDFFMNKLSCYEKHKPHFKAINPIISHNNLLLKENVAWRNSRKLLASVFHFDFIMNLTPLLVETSDEYIMNKTNEGTPLITNLLVYFEKLTLKIAIKIVIGNEYLQMEYQGQKIDVYLYSLVEEALRLHKSSSFFKYFKEVAFKKKVLLFEQFLSKELTKKFQDLRENKVKNSKSSILELLSQAEIQLTDILFEIVTMLVAATDTTGHFLTHFFLALEKNKDVKEKLKKEIKEKIKSEKDLTFEKIQSLEYLEGVIQEVLRLYSPIPDLFPRFAKCNHNLGDIKIKKGTIVNISLMTSNNDERFFEDSQKIRPERWIKGASEFRKNDDKNPFSHLPFSIGERNCIGQHLALLETKVIMIKFLMEKKCELIEQKKDIKWVKRFLYEPAEPVMARIV